VDWFAENWLTLTLFVLGFPLSAIIGYFISRYFYHLGIRGKSLCYTLLTLPMIRSWVSQIPTLKIHYHGHGQDLQSFSITLISFWNGGTSEIRKQDIVAKAPLAIVATEGGVILEHIIFKTTNPLNNIALTHNSERTQVNVAFDYLNPHDGARLVILHTGKGDLAVKGEIIGGPPPTRIPEIAMGLTRQLLVKTLVLISLGVFPVIADSLTFRHVSFSSTVLSLYTGYLLGFIPTYVSLLRHKMRVPKSFLLP
jgi:hypothetical protein